MGGIIPKTFSVKEKELGTIYDKTSLKMARDVATSLNNLMKIPIDEKDAYRKYKKDPRVKLEKILKYLLLKAQTKPKDFIPTDINIVIKDEHKKMINEMVIEKRTSNSIQKAIFDKFALHIELKTLQVYIRKFKKTNDYIKAAKSWIESADELRLAHKRGRLGELEEIYIDAYRRWKASPSKQNADMCLKILEQARKEAMPIMNHIQINNNTNIQANIFTNILAKEEELAVFENMPLHELIISKVAAKFKRDPYLLQRRLQNSYYAAQAGALGMEKLKEPIQYPTAILYNVQDLKGKWADIQAEEAQVLEEADIESKINQKPSDIKAALLKKVQEKKDREAQRNAGSNQNTEI